MGRVAEVRGFVIRVHRCEDGDGPHVHVFKPGRVYRVRLLVGDAEYIDSAGERRTRSEIRMAVKIARDNLKACWREWLQCHGRGFPR